MNDMVRTPKCYCPNCGATLDAATPVSNEAIAPQEGDLSICFKCATPLMFDEALKVRILPRSEIMDLPVESQRELIQGILDVKAFNLRDNRH